MNRRLSKKINKKTIDVFLQWLKTVVPEEEAAKISAKEYKSYVPEHAYYWDQRTIKNSLFSPRWIKRRLKEKIKETPLRDVESYNLADFK